MPRSPKLAKKKTKPNRAFASDFEARYDAQLEKIKTEQVRDFLCVPANDVIVERRERKFRTVIPTIPVSEYEGISMEIIIYSHLLARDIH